MEPPESKHYFKDLVESAESLVFELDKDGRFVYLNPAWGHTVGYTGETMIGKHPREFKPKDALSFDAEVFREKILARKPFGFETTYRHRDGHDVHVALLMRSEYDSEGNVLSYQGMGHDITRRVMSEAALEASEELFRIHVEHSFDVIFTLDSSGRFIYVSPAWERHFGYPAATAMGQLFAGFVHTDDIGPLKAYLDSCLSTGARQASPEYRVKHADGHWVWLIANGTPCRDRYGNWQYVGVARDITYVKRNRDALDEKSRELERLIYAVSHDLRSPLVNIEGFGDLLKMQIDDLRGLFSEDIPTSRLTQWDSFFKDEISPSLDYITTSVAKMKALLQGLLEVSRAGRMTFSIQPVDVAHLMAQVLDAHHYQLQQLQAKITVDPLPTCYGDHNQLNQLFSNLIANAIKYRQPERNLVLQISAIRLDDRIRYSIEDNGSGIDDRQIEKVWEAFYRGNNQSGLAGEGLGLSIVKRIALQHQGRAWCESQVGGGSVFHVELPSRDFSSEQT